MLDRREERLQPSAMAAADSGGTITKEDVRRVARLARLGLSEEELIALTDELGRILEHVSTLGTLTLPAEIAGPALEAICPLREDVWRGSPHRDDMLRATNKVDAGAVVVPKVLEGD